MNKDEKYMKYTPFQVGLGDDLVEDKQVWPIEYLHG